MSSPRWTKEQEAAINLRGQLLVAAAAGSGKTAVLVERLIRRITDPQESVDVDRFLVVTFTKAAAHEMRERVGKALDDALFAESNPQEVERLLHQRALLYRASITTLHSFCMELIRQYFYVLELDPAFRVADVAEADLLRQDALDELFEVYYSQENPDFLKLVDAFGTDRADQPLMEQVLKLYEFAMSQVHPEQWLAQLPNAYRWDNVDELLASPWGKAACQGMLDKIGESITLLERAYQLAAQPGGPAQYADILQDDLGRFKALAQSVQQGGWAEIERTFGEACLFPRLPSGGKKVKKASADNEPSGSPNLYDEEQQKAWREESKKLRDDAKKKLEKLRTSLFSFALDEQLPFLQEMADLLQTLSEVVLNFSREYTGLKRLRNVVDFSDLEHFALQLLMENDTPSGIAQNLQKHYEEVLVDEYQDINPVQERILQLVAREEGPEPNRFMVGDVKQSIYRFRMADPSLFLKKYSELPHWQPDSDLEKEPAPKLVIDLNRNFRSRQEVIEGVNFLFRQIMTEGAGEIAYDDQAALRHGAQYLNSPELKTAEGPIELHLFDPKAIRAAAGQNSEDSLVNQAKSPDGNVGEKAVMFDYSTSEGNSDEPNETSENDNGSEGSGEEPSLDELEAARIEARLVSERIRRMVGEKEFQVYDKQLSDFRPVQYSDIVILMRSFSAVAPIYVEEFQNNGIPVYAETSSGYFSVNEVETMLSLLKTIDNPRLDIPLAAVLRSPLVDLNGTELGKLRALLPQGDFYEALVLAYLAGQAMQTPAAPTAQSSSALDSDSGFQVSVSEQSRAGGQNKESDRFDEGDQDDESGLILPQIQNFKHAEIFPDNLPWLSEIKETLTLYENILPTLLIKARHILEDAPTLRSKVTAFWPKLQTWRQLSRRTSLADLIWQLYEETGYLSYVGTLPSGSQRQANLRVLYDRACRYEATNYRGLFRFLRFLEKFRDQGKDLGNARTLGENEDVVRLITVHSSKGLEFPVVFVVGLGSAFNTRSLNGRLLLHSELGAGIPLMDTENQIRYPSFIQYAVKERIWQESLAEELRILYVALTRAKERLLLYGSQKKLADALSQWYRLAGSCSEPAFHDGQLRSARNFLDWIIPALMRHPGCLWGEEMPVQDWLLADSGSQWQVVVHQTLSSGESESADFPKPLEPAGSREVAATAETAVARNLTEGGGLAQTTGSAEYGEASLDSKESKNATVEVPPDFDQLIDSRLSWQYPYSAAAHQSAKTSVSELKRRFLWYMDQESRPDVEETVFVTGTAAATQRDNAYERPKFLQGKRTLTPVEKGIAFHSLMQHLPLESWRESWATLSRRDQEEKLSELLQLLVQNEILTLEQAGTISAPAILALLNSPLGMRLLRGEEVRREVPFTLSLKLIGQNEPVLVQGVIDAVILSHQEGKAEIIDFKTDSFHGATDPEKTLTERYTIQLALYTLAVERLLKIPVKQCSIYATALNREVTFARDLLHTRLEEILADER